MAKKQFIRHLEFYGYPDQNGYSSEANCCDCVDLSEIIKKNKQQDKEIKYLTHEKADKKDLDVLSATVETIVSAQSEINLAFADAISGMAEDIEALKEADAQFAEELSAMTDDINEVTSGLSDAIDNIQLLEDKIDELSGNVEDFKETVENDYAKKDEVVTKEWIEEQGYLTIESGDSRYAKIEDLQEIIDTVESATTGINDEIDELNDKIDELSGDVTTEIEELQEQVSGITEDVEELQEQVSANTEDIEDLKEQVSGITEDVEELQEQVSANTEDIEDLQEQVSANTEDIEDLKEQVDANTEDIAELQEQVSANTEDIIQLGHDLEDTRTELLGEIDKKADKTDLAFVSGAVDDLSDKLEAEIQRSSGVDETMQSEIDSLSGDVVELSEQLELLDDRVVVVESGLTKEIADRIQGDLDLIGTSADTEDDDTIWGAKKYAYYINKDTLDNANDYTDAEITKVNGKIINLSATTDQKLTAYATEAFVLSACQDTETEIRCEFFPALSAETERAEREELNLNVQIQALSGAVINNMTEIAHNATRLNAITDWDGETPEDYPNWAATHPNAKGILDVLHREFHQLIDTLTQKGILP